MDADRQSARGLSDVSPAGDGQDRRDVLRIVRRGEAGRRGAFRRRSTATTAIPGAGVGHLFKFDASGKLLADVILGEGTIYHPGGIDYDGTDIWVPVAEYRPNSKSIVYRVDPQSMKATEVFRWADHIGGVVHDTEDQALHGVSWGSRRFYRWKLDANRRLANAVDRGKPQRTMNPSHYVDYQDCKYAGQRRMLCTGVDRAAAVAWRRAVPVGGPRSRSTCATAGRCTRSRAALDRRAVST